MTNLPNATWTEVDRASRRAMIVPLGSLEQHGPHLPLDTDTRIAVAVAAGAAAQRSGVAVAPALAFGASGEHGAFPGTVSIGTTALTDVIVELGRDVTRHWGSLLLVNAHGGNRDAVSAALRQLGGEGRRCAAFAVAPRDGDAHAGRTETSMLLHIDPSAVRGEDAEPGETRPIAELIGRLRSEGVRSASPNGVLGDPGGASAEEGRWLLEHATADCVATLDALLSEGAVDA